MPDLVEQMYCSQQIFIPPNLPSILKKYAKAAIRTQPGDLLTWSSAYFRALAEGIPPPAKDRIEYPPVDTPSGLSPGFLKVLINQIGKRETIHKDVLAERWKGVCLNPKALQDLLDVGMFEDEVSWLEFLAICVGTLEPSLTRTMIELCELLTDEPEGGRAAIPVTIFLNLYRYLAKLDCGPVNRLEEYEKTLKTDSETECQATDLKPTEEEEEAERTNIDWDTAIEGESKGGMSAGDEADEGIGIEAADIENGGGGDDAGEQSEVPSTEKGSTELEENTEAVEEEVSKIEVMNDAQLRESSDDVETEETGVSDEPEAATNLDSDAKENEVQNVESAPLTLAGNGTAEEEKGGVDNDGIGDVENVESNGGNEEQNEEVADGDENEGDTAQVREDGDADDKAADAATEEGDMVDDGGAVNTGVNQLDKAVDEAAGVDETAGPDGEGTQGGQGDNEADNLTADASANDDTEKQKADEGVVENEEESSEQPGAVDDTKDEKVGSTTPEETLVESTDPPGEGNGEKEEFVKADEGTTEIDETLKGDDTNEKTTTEVESVIAASADEPADVAQEEANQGETEETGNQADVANPTTADEVPQDQAEDDAQEVVDSQSLNNDQTEELTPQENISAEKKADDPPSDQGETDADLQVDLATASSANDAPQEQAEDAAQDEPSPIQTESEQPAVEDRKESTDAEDDVQNAANQSTEDGKGGTDDGNGLENTESADVLPEENATSENSASENVEQKTEDENGNDNTLLNVEEIINPKVAYIVNDDGTLSAPRSESVVDEDALKERDSDNSVSTKMSDDGMMVWPDIKPQEKEEADPEPLLEKEVTSEDGVEVFTDVQRQAYQEELKLVAEQQEEEPVEAEQEESIFAPQIDSFTDLLEAESAPVEEANPEQLAAAIESTELMIEDSGGVIPSVVLVSEAESDERASQGPAETITVPTEANEEGDQKREKKPRRQRKDVEIESLVKKDSDMMLLPTPITSDIMLYMDGACDKTGVKLSQTQQLNHKMSMIDVQVFVPVDETIVEVVQEQRYPKWMHIPGIGPTVPEHIIEEAENYFTKIAELQEGMVMPRNIKHFHCPPLELVPDCPDGAAEGI